MANIGVRSPYFVTDTSVGAVSSKILINIDSVLRYTIIKSGDTATLDISELVRDYIDTTYTGSLDISTVGSVSVDVSFYFYDGIDATGTQVATSTIPTLTAYEAYNYFSEGNNCTISNGVLLSANVIYAPFNTPGEYYFMNNNSLDVRSYGAAVTQSQGIQIKRQPCDKHTPIKCTFINKYGVHQDFYFFAKKTDSLNSLGDTYNSNVINNGTYSTSAHQVVDFNKNGKISYSLSTGYISQEANAYIQELLLSEKVWLSINGVVPVNVNSKSVEYKTSLNDKLVSYTIQFDQANDLISNVR